jgi:hypothetical protein
VSRGRRVDIRTPRAGKFVVGIVVLIILIVATACGLVELGSSEKAAVDRGASRGAALPGSSTEATETLDGLEITTPGSMTGYSRKKFPHWSEADKFGWDAPDPSCDSRDAALIRDGKGVKVGKSCDVTSGEWHDPYAGNTYSDPSKMDIDHVVPLANAWRSGASSWSQDLRERYANDPEVLLSVEAGANRSKGDKGPEAWKPPDKGEWCDYAERWIGIKAGYDLSVNQQEKAALEEMLATCEEG